MGWLTGFSGIQVPAKLILQPPALYEIHEPGLHARLGGPPETCCKGTLPQGAFLVTGMGIQDGRILQKQDWARRLMHSRADLENLDGHFIVMRQQSGRVEFFTDTAGVRTLFCFKQAGYVYFSSRLDWLAAQAGPFEIDYARFGAQWILANSIHTCSVLKHVLRIEPGGHAVIEQGRIQLQSRPWNCSVAQLDKTGSEYAQSLRRSLHIRGPKRWSLGLSGGLDSRVLLALQEDYTAHVWGPPDHPDVLVSRRLAQVAGLEQNYFQNPLPEVELCLRKLRERTGLTQVITPASASVERDAYHRLHAMGMGIMDGGFGEIARRQLMNQMVFARILHQPLPCPSTGKSDIFSPEIQRTMVRGARNDLHAAWHSLPPSMTVADKADMISVRSRLPNFFGFEQNYLDSVCLSYMPYAQPSVLRALFLVPLRLRWHGRLLRQLLRQHSPHLGNTPLVKGTIPYPFGMGTVSSFAYTQIRKLIGNSYLDPRPAAFIHHLREFILDTLRSHSVRSYAAYDQAKLQQMADGFARGEARFTAQLDWWLAFDTWRSILHQEVDIF